MSFILANPTACVYLALAATALIATTLYLRARHFGLAGSYAMTAFLYASLAGCHLAHLG